ncbi:PE domain-containing protein, partial [Mycobacteroides abscessus]
SLETAAGFSARGIEHSGVAAQAVEELGRAGLGVSESAASYTTGDMQAAAAYMIARG